MRSSIQTACVVLLVGTASLAVGLAMAAAAETVDVGSMSCYPESGLAKSGNVAVGSQDSGTYILRAMGGYTGADPRPACTFLIDIRESEVEFSGCEPGPLGPCGGLSKDPSIPCTAEPGEFCPTTVQFDWWRAAHAVSFTVPFDLKVNGVTRASGSFTFMDPPLWDELTSRV